MPEEDFDEKLREHRRKNFTARVHTMPEDLRLFPDEVRLEVSYNGRQSTPLALNKQEAERVIAALKAAFYID